MNSPISSLNSYWVTLVFILLGPIDSSFATEQSLLESLREGGMTLILQTTEAQTGDYSRVLWPPKCLPQTRLTQTGWREALQIGVGLRKQGIHIEQILTSPACATRHFAYLIVGADKVRLDENLIEFCGNSTPITTEQSKRLRRLAAKTPPYTGSNLAIVTHACNLNMLVQSNWPSCSRATNPGDAIVVRGNDRNRLEFIACLPKKELLEWSQIPEHYSK